MKTLVAVILTAILTMSLTVLGGYHYIANHTYTAGDAICIEHPFGDIKDGTDYFWYTRQGELR